MSDTPLLAIMQIPLINESIKGKLPTLFRSAAKKLHEFSFVRALDEQIFFSRATTMDVT